MAVEKVVVHPAAVQELKRALGDGLANYGFAFEGRAKVNAPVRGGHRSVAPGGPVGGTLRRSIHSAVYVNGQRVSGGGSDENGRGLPAHDASGADIVLVVGTNIDYGEYVHNGTRRMAARPFLTEALMETRDQAPALIEAGARRRLGGI